MAYRAKCPGGEEYVNIADAYRRWFAWRPSVRGDNLSGIGSDPGRFVALGRYGNYVTKPGDRYAFIAGRVLAPGRVAAVEASFDDGGTARGRVEGQAFILVGWGARNGCELRALDPGGRVLERIPLVGSSGPGVARGCPRPGAPKG